MYINQGSLLSFQWNTITPSSDSNNPPSRWGHSSCIVNNDLYLFGGFANGQYMNDLWMYSLNTMQWKQITTYGDVPQKRSNASLNYDPVNNQLLLFGGGGPSKQRKNTVSCLDLNTLSWIEIQPFENQPAPWERTYHVAQFKFPYLIVFGGQGIDDLGDLWIYDCRNLTWEQIKITGVKPCARRFHASCLVDQKMYIMGGCYGKYKCLGDLFCLDITQLIQTGKGNSLKWQKIELSGNIEERWGHTLDYFGGNLYIFGGRSNQDMNDLSLISLQSSTIQTLQTYNNPKARRRHSGGFIGSSLVLFGGFNGNYFEDLFYINLYQTKMSTSSNKMEQEALIGSPEQYIFTIHEEKYPIYASLLGKYFKEQRLMLDFLKQIDMKYYKKELSIIFSTFYKGWGPLPLKPSHFRFLKIVPSQQYQTSSMLISSFMQWPINRLQQQSQLQMVELQSYKYKKYMQFYEQHWQMDRCLILNNQHKFTCCSRILSLFSEYFNYMFSNYKQQMEINLNVKNIQAQTFKIVLAYLHTNILVIPKQNNYKLFKQIYQLSEYFSISKLKIICEQQLSRKVTKINYKDLNLFSKQFSMQKLEEICCLNMLNQLIENNQHQQNLLLQLPQLKSLDYKSKELFQLLVFDLAHKKEDMKKGKVKENKVLEEKENQNVPNTLDHKDSSKRMSLSGGN